MKHLLKTICIFSITIGVIALGINLLFGEGTISYIESKEILGQEFKVFNFYKYIQNLTIAFEDVSYLTLELPTRTWDNSVSSLQDLGNNIAVMVNYLIMVINILMYPFKLTGYILKIVLTIIGVNITNTNSNIYWLVNFANSVQSLSIPYI